MRGEEVSREIPFIFSRAFADTRPRSVGRAGKVFVCGWKRGGSRDAPAGTGAGSRLEEAESPRGLGGGEMGWPGHSGHPRDGRWVWGSAPRAAQRSLGPGTPRPLSAHGTQVPALGAGGSAQLAQMYRQCPSVTPESSECQRDSVVLSQPGKIPMETHPHLHGTLLQRLGLTAPGLLQQEKISWHKHSKRQVSPSLFGKNFLNGGEEGNPRGAREVWGHPPLCHRPAAFCPFSLSLHPTWTITNLSLQFELCHLPPGSPLHHRHRCHLPLLAKGGVPAQPGPVRAEPDPVWLPGIGAVVAVHDICCLGWHPLVLRCSSPHPPLSQSTHCSVGLVSPQGSPLPFPSVGRGLLLPAQSRW